MFGLSRSDPIQAQGPSVESELPAVTQRVAALKIGARGDRERSRERGGGGPSSPRRGRDRRERTLRFNRKATYPRLYDVQEDSRRSYTAKTSPGPGRRYEIVYKDRDALDDPDKVVFPMYRYRQEKRGDELLPFAQDCAQQGNEPGMALAVLIAFETGGKDLAATVLAECARQMGLTRRVDFESCVFGFVSQDEPDAVGQAWLQGPLKHWVRTSRYETPYVDNLANIFWSGLCDSVSFDDAFDDVGEAPVNMSLIFQGQRIGFNPARGMIGSFDDAIRTIVDKHFSLYEESLANGNSDDVARANVNLVLGGMYLILAGAIYYSQNRPFVDEATKTARAVEFFQEYVETMNGYQIDVSDIAADFYDYVEVFFDE